MNKTIHPKARARKFTKSISGEKRVEEAKGALVTFSFKELRLDAVGFKASSMSSKLWIRFCDKLKWASNTTWEDIGNIGKRSHGFRNDDPALDNIKAMFPDDIRKSRWHQIDFSEAGRFVGFIIAHCFYIVVLDPKHNVNKQS